MSNPNSNAEKPAEFRTKLDNSNQPYYIDWDDTVDAIYDLADAIAGSSVSRDAGTVEDAFATLAQVATGAAAKTPADAETSIRACIGKLMVKPTATLTITENATNIDVLDYAKVNVNVPNPSTGTLTITENGENIDVTQYAAVTVAVPTTPAQ